MGNVQVRRELAELDGVHEVAAVAIVKKRAVLRVVDDPVGAVVGARPGIESRRRQDAGMDAFEEGMTQANGVLRRRKIGDRAEIVRPAHGIAELAVEHEGVVARPADQSVIAPAADQHVISRPGVQDVVAPAAAEEVVAAEAGKLVLAVCSDDDVFLAGRCRLAVNAVHRADGIVQLAADYPHPANVADRYVNRLAVAGLGVGRLNHHAVDVVVIGIRRRLEVGGAAEGEYARIRVNAEEAGVGAACNCKMHRVADIDVARRDRADGGAVLDNAVGGRAGAPFEVITGASFSPMTVSVIVDAVLA